MTITRVDALLPDGRTVPLTLDVSDAPPWSIRAEGQGMPTDTFAGDDVFDAFTALRRALEPAGVVPLCQGARPDTFPSGMSRSMGAGRGVYRVELGRGTDAPPVDLFAPAAASEVGTVAAQEAYRQRWVESLRRVLHDDAAP